MLLYLKQFSVDMAEKPANEFFEVVGPELLTMRLSNRVFKSKEAQKAVAAGAIEWQMWANSLGVLAGFGT